MRDIIFRGKRKSNNQWVEGSLLVYADGGCFICCQDLSSDVLNKYEVDPATVGQYSGLMDKNGKRIFEGDIVTDSNIIWTTKGIVTFGEGTFDSGFYRYNGWCVIDKDGNKDHCPLVKYEDEWDNFYVIGNIHDNPELLQGQE